MISDRVDHKTLRVSEIFYSIQGETSLVGLPTAFIRLTGCPLRCQYCDTAYAFHGGTIKKISEIVGEVSRYQTQYITVTGGEPLAQKACFSLLTELCNRNYIVSLETSGALDISSVDPRVIKILDIKTPGSGEAERNLYENLHHITDADQIKFVICNQEDYIWAKNVITNYRLFAKTHVLLSPSHSQLAIQSLADWMLEDKLPARLQMQFHKYIWGDVPGK